MPAPAVREDAWKQPPPSGVCCAKAPSWCQGRCRSRHTLLARSSLRLRGLLSSTRPQRSENSLLASPKSWASPHSWDWDVAFPCTLKMNQNRCFVRNQKRAFHGDANRPFSLGFPKSQSFLCLHKPHRQEPHRELRAHPKSSTTGPDRGRHLQESAPNTPCKTFRSFSPFAGYAGANTPRPRAVSPRPRRDGEKQSGSISTPTNQGT